jgi:hypothetical protein
MDIDAQAKYFRFGCYHRPSFDESECMALQRGRNRAAGAAGSAASAASTGSAGSAGPAGSVGSANQGEQIGANVTGQKPVELGDLCGACSAGWTGVHHTSVYSLVPLIARREEWLTFHEQHVELKSELGGHMEIHNREHKESPGPGLQVRYSGILEESLSNTIPVTL